MHKEKSPN